ncbi:MAG TPA: amidohydrolase family protein [Mycobacteriales bacterium]
MIIDCHGHYTTAPAAFKQHHRALLEARSAGRPLTAVREPRATDDELRATVEGVQVRLQRERGIDLTILSPIAGLMAHHLGDAGTAAAWARSSNNLVQRICSLYPQNFVGACQLPQSPGVSPAKTVGELRRCVEELGFVGCIINPDPSGGSWSGAPMTDRSWYPLYEAMVELDVPAMIHTSGTCNPNLHATGSWYLIGDTAVFVQLLLTDLFADFPTLRFVIPHGGGAVPFHWGRFRGLAMDLGRAPIEETVLGQNVFFDTCVYHECGMRLLLEVIPPGNVLFGSEMVGAVRSDDPATGHAFDDTGRYVDALGLNDDVRDAVCWQNAARVYPRLSDRVAAVSDRSSR